MDGHSKREVLEIFNLNNKNVIHYSISFLKPATISLIMYDF